MTTPDRANRWANDLLRYKAIKEMPRFYAQPFEEPEKSAAVRSWWRALSCIFALVVALALTEHTRASWVFTALTAAALAIVGGVGCVKGGPATNVISLNTSPRALHEREPGSVTIFTTGAPIRPFVEVALIESRREWGAEASAQEVFQRMRVAAARFGCDGLVLLGEANIVSGLIWPVIGSQGPETNGSIETMEGYRSACIVWRDEAVGATPPAPVGTTN
jgi:hypothetical protein